VLRLPDLASETLLFNLAFFVFTFHHYHPISTLIPQTMDSSSLPDSNDEMDNHGLAGSLSRFKPDRKATLMRFFQNLDYAETPPDPMTPKYHTGKLPNSKSGDGKPRLLLMGQKR
jgi:hypothetical protein